MSGQERHIVAERKQVFADRTNQIGMVATREIRASDRAREQHIADDRKARIGMKENDVSRRMPRTVSHFKLKITHRDLITLL